MRRLIYTIFLVMSCYISYGQDYVMKGNAAYNAGNYSKAIQYYTKYDKLALDPDILELRGMSYFHVNELKNAIRDFTIAKKLGNTNPDMYYRMGVIKHSLGEIEEAIFFYKTFMDQVDNKNKYYDRAERELKNCVYIAFHQAKEEVASVQSFGDEVNTAYDEIYPIRSPRYGNVYYLSTNRNKKDFEINAFSINKKGDWTIEPDIVADVNTAKHDYLQDVSADGRSLLFLKQGAETLDRKLTFSTYIDDEEIKIDIPRIILKDVTDIQIVDHNTLAFSSDKLAGAGGYDIYTIDYSDGKWSEPKNLGPTINTMYDDRFPFFVNGMKQIYYSSNRPYAFGGFDIYYNDLSENGKSINIGQPVNTPGDDINFRLDADGHTAIYSSNTKIGRGGFDLYFAYMREVKELEPRDSLRFQFVEDVITIEQKKQEEQLAAKREKEKQRKLKAENAAKKKAEELAAIAAKEKAEKERELKKQREIAEAEKLKKELTENLKKTESIVAEKEKEKRRKEQEAAKALAAKDKANKEQEKRQNAIAEAEKETDTKTTEVRTVEPSDVLDMPIPNSKELITKDYKVKKLKAIDSYIIYYQDRQDLLNDRNKMIIHAMALNLYENENHHIRLMAYTDSNEPGLPEFVQYNTLLRAKTISDYLMDLGIQSERIHIESLAANYPAARKEVAGLDNEEFSYLNRRIETQVVDSNGKIIQDHRIDPTVMSLSHRDRKYILFQDIRDELYYSVKVASTPRIFKNAILRMYDDIYIRKESASADNDYYIGVYTKYADAKALQEQVSTSSAPLSEIVAFYNGKPIAPEDIKALSAEYPDLDNYGVK